MTDPIPQRRAAVELEVVSTSGVRTVYPSSVLPGAPKVVITGSGGDALCELRIGADDDAPAIRLIDEVAAAARRASGCASMRVRIEIASID